MSENQEIDRTDIDILRLLTKDARLSNKEIAASVGLAPSSCYERTRDLRKRGVLLGSHAEVDWAGIGLALEALLFVQLDKLSRQAVDKFVRDTAAVPEVRSVFLVSGHFDLIVHLVARDMDHLKTLISARFNSRAAVLRVETSMIFNRQTRHDLPVAETDEPARG